jgi:DDE superfamily endonuclease
MLNHFIEFRQDLYDFFSFRKDSLIDLIDSLAGNHNATSVVRLSLEPTYPRSYSTINKAIDYVFQSHSPKELTRTLQKNLPPCQILVTDVVPIQRLFAEALQERCCIHKSSSIKGQKPITIGHNYSLVCALAPEERWTLPLSVERVKPVDVRTLVGINQLEQILKDSTQKWIHVADTDYSGGKVLKRLAYLPCTSLIRMRSNRVLYFPAKKPKKKRFRRPKIYGKKFYFKHPCKACEEIIIPHKDGYFKIERWNNLLVRDVQVQIDVVRIRLYKKNSIPVFKHPLWLAVVGQRDINTRDIQGSYKRRFDIEHFLRFGKQKLLLNSFQTPEVASEENWIWITMLAQWMLYLAKEYAAYHPLPWEKKRRDLPTPSLVQREYSIIIKDFAQYTHFPKRRGYSHGRLPGTKLPKRKHHKIIKKWKFKQNKARAPPKTVKKHVKTI